MAEAAPPDTRMEGLVWAAARVIRADSPGETHDGPTGPCEACSDLARDILEAAGIPALIERLDAAEAVCENVGRVDGVMNTLEPATMLLVGNQAAYAAWRALRDKAPS